MLAELRDLVARHADADYRGTAIAGVTVMASDTPTRPLVGVTEPTFALVVQGAKRTALGDTLFDYGAGQYLIALVELPVTAHVVSASPRQPFLAFGLKLRPSAIATLVLQAADLRGPATEPALAVSNATPDLLDPAVRLLRLLDRTSDIPVLAASIEREILWRLLNGEQGAMVRQVGLADSRLSQIARAIRQIRGHYSELLRIGDLADEARMSVTTFHRHFRAITTMSPLQYQKQIRLQEARTRLMAQPDDVAAVGFAVGYDSPSQFSREYRRLFGAPPRQDAVRLRALTTAV